MRVARALTLIAWCVLLALAPTAAQNGPTGVHPCGWPEPTVPPSRHNKNDKVEWYSDAVVQSGPLDIYKFARSVANLDTAPRQIYWAAGRLTTALNPGFQAWVCAVGQTARDLADGPVYYGNLPRDSMPTTVYVGKNEPTDLNSPSKDHVVPLQNIFMAGKYRAVDVRDMQVGVSITSTVEGSTMRWEIRNLTPRPVRFSVPIGGVVDEQWKNAAAGRVLAPNETAVATATLADGAGVIRESVPLTLVDAETGRLIAVIDVNVFVPPPRRTTGP